METAAQAPTRLSIDVWSDIVCPFCYLGERRLAQAIARSSHADRTDLSIHTFQLDPTLPASPIATLDHLSAKHGVPVPMHGDLMNALVTEGFVADTPTRADIAKPDLFLIEDAITEVAKTYADFVADGSGGGTEVGRNKLQRYWDARSKVMTMIRCATDAA